MYCIATEPENNLSDGDGGWVDGVGGDSHDSSHQFRSTIKEVTYIFPRGLNASLLMPVIHPTPQPANTTSVHTRAQRERQVEKVSEGWYY